MSGSRIARLQISYRRQVFVGYCFLCGAKVAPEALLCSEHAADRRRLVELLELPTDARRLELAAELPDAELGR